MDITLSYCYQQGVRLFAISDTKIFIFLQVTATDPLRSCRYMNKR